MLVVLHLKNVCHALMICCRDVNLNGCVVTSTIHVNKPTASFQVSKTQVDRRGLVYYSMICHALKTLKINTYVLKAATYVLCVHSLPGSSGNNG